jgi:hypothetical protein
MQAATAGRIIIGDVQFDFQKGREGEGEDEGGSGGVGAGDGRVRGGGSASGQLRAVRDGTRDAVVVRGDVQHGTGAATQRHVPRTSPRTQIAIEYYINEDPRKANHFQKKLTTLLTHPYTLELIDNKPRAKTPEVDTAQYSSHLRMELNKFNTQSDIVIRSMIEGSNKKVEKSHRLMNDNISSQEDMLSKRMQERSRSKKKLETPNNNK